MLQKNREVLVLFPTDKCSGSKNILFRIINYVLCIEYTHICVATYKIILIINIFLKFTFFLKLYIK